MKKFFAALLALTLLLSAGALADTDGLTKAELDAYSESILRAALTENRYQAEAADGGYFLYCPHFTLRCDQDRLTANTNISEIIFDDLSDVDESSGDLRGIRLNDSLSTLLAAYPLENRALAGTREEAVLYISGELPGQAAVGYVRRDGQRTSEVQHLLYYMADGGVRVAKITYEIKDGAVVRSCLQLNADSLTLTDAKAELSAYWDIREETEYSQYLPGADNGDQEAFSRDDLLFSGLDFLELTPQDAIAVLGDDYAEDWLEDGDTYLHVMEWNAATMTFLHGKDKELLRPDTLLLDEGTLEGPRGIRVGDQQQLVMDSFKTGAGEMQENVTYLYGAPGDDSYGMAEFSGQGQMNLRYVCVAEDHTVTMLLTMENARLREILLMME